MDILTLSLRDRFLIMFMLINTAARRDKVGPWSPVVGESVPIHKPERKANGCLGTTDVVPDVCVRFALQG